MTKRAVILHGTNAHPDEIWQPWFREQLEQNGYAVLHPELPENSAPNKEVYNNFLFSQEWDFADNLMVGHSSGSTAILNLLLDERCPAIKAAVMVGAFLKVTPDLTERLGFKKEQFAHLFPDDGFDYDLIKKKCAKFYFVHGDNDPYCPIRFAREAASILNGEFIVVPGGHHLGSTSGVTELPQVLEALERDHIL